MRISKTADRSAFRGVIKMTVIAKNDFRKELEAELERLKKILKLGYELKVRWIPNNNSKISGEVRSNKQKFIQNIRNDPHITLAFDVKEGRYNILLFGAFRNLEEELEWEIKQGLFLPKSIGHVDIQYFSPKSIVNISQTNVSLGMIDEKYMYFRT